MRKEILREIKKELKKDNLIGVTFNPTLEECDYLFKYNITTTKSVSRRKTLIGEFTYSIDTTDFCIE